jgi:hypothetical protein
METLLTGRQATVFISETKKGTVLIFSNGGLQHKIYWEFHFGLCQPTVTYVSHKPEI